MFIRVQLGDGASNDSTVVVSDLTWPHHFTWFLDHEGMDAIIDVDDLVTPIYNRPAQTGRVVVEVNGIPAGSVDASYDWAGTNTKDFVWNLDQWDSRAAFALATGRWGDYL